MNTLWTVICSVVSSVLASVSLCGILGWLCREWISARLRASIQHEYDIKLEDFKSRIHYEYELKLESSKTDFQKILNEHQTRFNYWHAEKAKTIKVVYSYLSFLYYNLNMLLSVEIDPIWNANIVIKKQRETDLKQAILKKMADSIQEWLMFRLYLGDKEDALFAVFQNNVDKLYDICNESNEYTFSEEKRRDIDMLLRNLEAILNHLRKVFQDILQGKADENG